jgi:predicted transcriptional regulator
MLLLSIHPRHVDSILAGGKRVELRRRKPSVEQGPGLIYATSPRMELAATFRIAKVTRAPLILLWQLVRDTACVTRREFDAYFQGLDCGVAIHLADVAAVSTPISLKDMRDHWPGFQPPQGFRYLSESEVSHLLPRKQPALRRRVV